MRLAFGESVTPAFYADLWRKGEESALVSLGLQNTFITHVCV